MDCKCDIELDVALPEPEEPAGCRKREIPSEGREGSEGPLCEALLITVCWNAGDAFEPVGVMVAETEERHGAALCLLRRREVTTSASGGRE